LGAVAPDCEGTVDCTGARGAAAETSAPALPLKTVVKLAGGAAGPLPDELGTESVAAFGVESAMGADTGAMLAAGIAEMTVPAGADPGTALAGLPCSAAPPPFGTACVLAG